MAKKNDDLGWWVLLGGLGAAAIAIAAASAKSSPSSFPCPSCGKRVELFAPTCGNCGVALKWPTV